MQAKTDNSRRALLEQIKSILVNRMSAKAAKQAALFSDVYFKRVPVTDLGKDSAVVFATMVARQLDFLQQRRPGESLIRVFNPENKKRGWECKHSSGELSNDDMPFLVDTANMAMREFDLSVHLIVHPVFNIERDADGKLIAFHPKANKRTRPESFIHILFEKQNLPTAN